MNPKKPSRPSGSISTPQTLVRQYPPRADSHLALTNAATRTSVRKPDHIHAGSLRICPHPAVFSITWVVAGLVVAGMNCGPWWATPITTSRAFIDTRLGGGPCLPCKSTHFGRYSHMTAFTREHFDSLMTILAEAAAEARDRGEDAGLLGYTEAEPFSFVVVVDNAGQAVVGTWGGDVIDTLVTNGYATIDTFCWRSPVATDP